MQIGRAGLIVNGSAPLIVALLAGALPSDGSLGLFGIVFPPYVLVSSLQETLLRRAPLPPSLLTFLRDAVIEMEQDIHASPMKPEPLPLLHDSMSDRKTEIIAEGVEVAEECDCLSEGIPVRAARSRLTVAHLLKTALRRPTLSPHQRGPTKTVGPGYR